MLQTYTTKGMSVSLHRQLTYLHLKVRGKHSMFINLMQSISSGLLDTSFDILTLLVQLLSVYRISFFIINEAGPFRLGTKFREWFTDAANYDDGSVSIPANGLFGCMYCLSFWVSAVLMFVPVVFLVPFSLSAGAILIHRWHSEQ